MRLWPKGKPKFHWIEVESKGKGGRLSFKQGKKAPSPQPILLKTVRSAVAAAVRAGRGLPLVAGGKSMGGRMTSLAASVEPLDGVRGLVFFGFPLHAPGRSGS